MDEEVRIRTPEREVVVCGQSEVREAAQEIFDATGGSSAMGAWSMVFGLLDADPVHEYPDDGLLVQLGAEASHMRSTLGDRLQPTAQAFLDRLASLPR